MSKFAERTENVTLRPEKVCRQNIIYVITITLIKNPGTALIIIKKNAEERIDSACFTPITNTPKDGHVR